MSAQTDLFQESNQKYCIDACAILDFWGSVPGYTRNYDVGVSQFRALWNHIAEKIDEGEIILSRVIVDEINKTTEQELKEWLDARASLFVDYDDAETELTEIINKFEIYTTPKASLHDAILVATAKKRGISVITSERKSNPLSYQNPKIPNVCEEVNVEWYSLPDYFKLRRL